MSVLPEQLKPYVSLELAILGAVFVTVVLLVLSAAFALDQKRRVSARLGRLMPAAESEEEFRQTPSGKAFKEILARIGTAIVQDPAADQSHLRRRLAQAGYRSRTSPSLYYGARIFLALFLPLVAALGLYLGGLATARNSLFACAIAAIVGFYLPVAGVAHIVRRRQAEVAAGFPDALDMLLVCVESGGGLTASLERVAQEVARPHPVLAEELALMALEINAGTARAEALRRFSERVGIDDVTSFVTLLIQSDAFGTSIAESLRVQADDMRRKRMLRAEEKANRLPVKIALPLVLFIFPALLIVIMTPVLIRILEAIKMTG